MNRLSIDLRLAPKLRRLASNTPGLARTALFLQSQGAPTHFNRSTPQTRLVGLYWSPPARPVLRNRASTAVIAFYCAAGSELLGLELNHRSSPEHGRERIGTATGSNTGNVRNAIGARSVARESRGLIGKQNLYEHWIRVPLIFDGPGIPADQRTDAMCYLFDVLPTLGKLCDVAAPPHSEDIDLSPTLGDPNKPARSRLMFAYQEGAARDDRWKLIRYPQVDRTQLFDLQADPQETRNLVGEPAYAAKVAEMTALLEEEMKQAGDMLPLKVANPKTGDWKPPVK